ncbi:MAG: ribosomal protein S18-alanine N-acetyltransferase [Anaerolineae bacterium]|nr:ribosomal protein S18-alanine N-acetyltransferase [Anaerolineae bacterium]
MSVPPVASLPFYVDVMRLEDIPEVMAIERRVFTPAWSSGIYRRELLANPWSHYRVVRSRGVGLPSILAYGGVWQMGDVAHIPTIATHPDYSGRHLGSYLLVHLLLIAAELGCTEVTLEVRVSNARAIALYRRHGFVEVGRRPRYYSDNDEDALLMTRYGLDRRQLMAELTAVEATLAQIWLGQTTSP